MVCSSFMDLLDPEVLKKMFLFLSQTELFLLSSYLLV